ncbi:S24 family peptidase [Hydrogenophaga sp.]|uniref:LexA family protein n=1 Tax=Hydrogenophaga sp. TaxID=1904254 RepID=UPI0025C002CF|nr:S24 family peptidase [Hydrogenophaga sp.]
MFLSVGGGSELGFRAHRVCRARGDSMRDAGILDKDMLDVERNTTTEEGDTVVVVVDNEPMVKTLFIDCE